MKSVPPQQHSASGWAQQKAAGDPQYLPARAPGCWVTRATGMTSQGMQGNSARGVRDAIAVARETAGDILQVSWVLGWGQSSPASPAAQQGLGGLWDMSWGLALSLPSPWGTGEEMRRRFPSWGHCHPHLGLVEQGQRGHCSLPHHCWISTKQHPGTHSPACLMEPTPWRKTFTPPCHLQLNPSLCFPLLKCSETPQTPQDFFPSVPNSTTITPGRVSPHP